MARGQTAAYHPDLFRTADFLISFNPRATAMPVGLDGATAYQGDELQVGASLLSAFASMIGGTLRVGLPMSLQSFGFVPDAFSPPALGCCRIIALSSRPRGHARRSDSAGQ
jgi:hypothetical protein